jgi:transposase-like protein
MLDTMLSARLTPRSIASYYGCLNVMPYECPVCGYPDLSEPSRVNGAGSYEICPSCGFQFGVSDDNTGISYDDWRESWVDQGMPWNSKGISPPRNWNPARQRAHVKR